MLVVDDEDGKPPRHHHGSRYRSSYIAKNIDVNDCTVEQVLSEVVETVPDTAGVFDCIHKMRTAGVRRMPVTNEQGRVVGIISFGEYVRDVEHRIFQAGGELDPAKNKGLASKS